jgi:hypothetical protein
VLVSHAELAALRETIAIVSDPAVLEDIRQAKADVLAGDAVNAEELREAVLARRPATRGCLAHCEPSPDESLPSFIL